MGIARALRTLGFVALIAACKKESTGAPSTSCGDRVDAFDEALASPSAGACATDNDCKCFPGGVSKRHACGGVSDTATSAKVATLASDYLSAGCKSGIDCAATMCLASCQNGRCTDGPPPKPGVTCDARSAEIDKVLASATRKCAADKDCACFRGSVSKSQPCGGITDAKTNARFETLAKEWSGAGCRLENVMCPQVVCSAACNNGTCGAPGTVIR